MKNLKSLNLHYEMYGSTFKDVLFQKLFQLPPLYWNDQ